MSAREDDATQAGQGHDDAFVPRGAIAFMILMVAAYGLIWFLFYLLMLGRP